MYGQFHLRFIHSFRFVSFCIHDTRSLWVLSNPNHTDGVQSKIKPKQQLCTARSPYLHTSTLTHSRRPATTEPRKTGHNKTHKPTHKTSVQLSQLSSMCFLSPTLSFWASIAIQIRNKKQRRGKKREAKTCLHIEYSERFSKELHFVCEQCKRIILDSISNYYYGSQRICCCFSFVDFYLRSSTNRIANSNELKYFQYEIDDGSLVKTVFERMVARMKWLEQQPTEHG